MMIAILIAAIVVALVVFSFLCYKKAPPTQAMNCTPFVRQYGILFRKWGVFVCQKEYQTNDIRRNSREWL